MDKTSKQIIDQNKDVYNAIAHKFNSTRDYLWNDLKPLEQYVADGQTIIDAGCGNGRLYQLFKKNQVNYIGTDQSEGLIEIAKKRFPEGKFEVTGLTEMDLEEEIADRIFAIASFHHLPDTQTRLKSLKRLKRLLKPDGLLIMTNWNLYSDWAKGKNFKHDDKGNFFIPWLNPRKEVLGERYYYGFVFEELYELAEAAGLEIVKQYYTKDGEETSIGPGDNILTVMKKAS